MSRQELVDAYLEGSLNRRAFVRRLVASGVSVGAAAGYAQILAPGAAAEERAPRAERKGGAELYPRVIVRITTRDLKDVRQNNRLKIKVTSSTADYAHVSAFLDKGGHLLPLGFTPFDPENARFVNAGQAKSITIPFNQSLHPLAGLDKARVQVDVRIGFDVSTIGFAKATLK
jgi:hypothetical protein